MSRCLPHCLRPRENFTQQAYRYGIGLSCIGVVLNWLGVADSAVEHVRYLGVFLVIIGSFLIVASMCHWMVAGPQTPPQASSQELTTDNDLHVVSVTNSSALNSSTDPGGNPPDYSLVVDKPPSYEQAMNVYIPHLHTSPTTFTLQSDSSLPPYSSRFDVMAGYNREEEEEEASELQKNLDSTDSLSLPPECLRDDNIDRSSGPLSLDNMQYTNRSDNQNIMERNSNRNSCNSTNELLLQPQTLCSVHSTGRTICPNNSNGPLSANDNSDLTTLQSSGESHKNNNNSSLC